MSRGRRGRDRMVVGFITMQSVPITTNVVSSNPSRYTYSVAYLPTYIRVITKLPNSEQSYKGKVKTHNYINRQNQSTTGKPPDNIYNTENRFVTVTFEPLNIFCQPFYKTK